MTKRRRENGEPTERSEDEVGLSAEEKRAKASTSVAHKDTEAYNDSSLVGDTNLPVDEQSSHGRGQSSQRSENSSDGEDRHDLLKQSTSFDGDDSASDKGSMMEETNSHLYQELLDAILKMKDGNGRLICELFLKLPPRLRYPEYFKVIKDPIDLKMIYSRVKNNTYSSLDDLEKDLQLLVKNAHAFNEPGSQVYKDATAIKKMISVKRMEIEHTLSGAKSSKRLRSKRSSVKMSLAIHALLSDTDDDDDMELSTQMQDDNELDKTNVEFLEGDKDDPFLALYNSVRMYTDYSGRIVSEAFMRLPSKRAYPDYYEVIKNPIGLLKIGSNIKNGYFESLDDVANEMTRCFDNAKAYNETESMLYQDAATLQGVLQSRKTDIVKISLEKGIPLTRPAKTPKAVRAGEHGTGEEGESESKPETPLASTKASKKAARKPGQTEPHENTALKKRMRDMYDTVESYQDENGRYLSQLFLELPSAEFYPDYYEIISEPTCLRMIDKNMRDGKYTTEQQFMLDFEIMFENAKHYNEVGSQVHQDALTLDKVLKKKRKSLHARAHAEGGAGASPSVKPTTPSNKQTTPTKSSRTIATPKSGQGSTTTDLKELCKELYNSVKDFTDQTGRYLCGIFQKLPSKTDYPDYYALIKRPIDMAKISTKLHADQYGNLEECFQDFVLMFDNACKYNDPDSQVYKDSLVLLKELFATKLELLGDCETQVPNVPELVQKLIQDLYDTVIHHQDDEGRCVSDSLVLMPNAEEVDESGQKKNILSLPTIGKLVKKGYYKRLDKFQEDLFTFFEKTRTSRHDSEVYEDAVDLQMFFVQQRDRVCKDGERFVSPAISQTKRILCHELDEERKRKQKDEVDEENETTKDSTKDDDQGTALTEIQFGEQSIVVGDYIYVDTGEKYIVVVEKMWADEKETKWVRGSCFLRPDQTVHEPTRKFIDKEVLRSDKVVNVNVSQVNGFCYVMFVKNYMRSLPLDVDETDVHVCESTYNVARNSFKKIKTWSTLAHHVKHMTRDPPLALNRAPLPAPEKRGGRKSVMVVKKNENNDEELIKSLFEVKEEQKNLEIESSSPEGFVNYEQYWVNDGCYKLGDTVYAQTDEGYWTVARIDKIWADKQNVVYFSGTTFIKPNDTQHLPTHMFYDKEMFHIPAEEVFRITDIIRKCFVLPIREFMRCRPTDLPEEDVFLCECRYEEDEGGHYRKLKGLKRPTLSTNVFEEEFYFFEDNINVVKKPSPLLVQDVSNLKRDDRIPSPSVVSDPEHDKAKKRSRAQNGFLLFSTERRSAIRKQNPEYSFGDISRVIGTEWKSLIPVKREEWESRGQLHVNAKAAAQGVSSPTYSSGGGPGVVYDCLWQGCDYQYEDLSELIIHVLESGGHLMKLDNGICPCLWRNCDRLKRGLRPFTSLTKLIRHCREMHLKGPPRRLEFHERSKNYFPKNQAPIQPESAPPPVQPALVNQPAQPGNPAFVGVVPSPTPSHLLGPSPSINITSSLLDPQFSNVMRLPTPGLAQTMMGLSSSYGNQTMTAMQASQNATNLARQGVVNGTATVTSMNQYGQMTSMGAVASPQQQYGATLPQFSSPYQQHMSPDGQMPPPAYPGTLPGMQQQQPMQQAGLMQAPPRGKAGSPAGAQVDLRQTMQQQAGMFPMQRAPFMDTQSNDAQMTPLFHSPPPRQQKLLHSDAYLRYIEGLRDGTPHLSNWNPQKPDANKMTPQQHAQLPAHWLGTAYNPHPSTVDALWALREHMLNDALKLSKFNQN